MNGDASVPLSCRRSCFASSFSLQPSAFSLQPSAFSLQPELHPSYRSRVNSSWMCSLLSLSIAWTAIGSVPSGRTMPFTSS